MKYLRRVDSKDQLVDPKLGKPSVFWVKSDDLIKIFSASSDPEIAKVYIDGTAKVFELSTEKTFSELGYTSDIYDITDLSKTANDSYPINGHKYTTTIISVNINNADTPTSANYIFSDQGYTSIYKSGNMKDNFATELPDEGDKYWTETYSIYVDKIDNVYQAKSGTHLKMLDMEGLATYVYDDYKTSEWIAFSDTIEFDEKSTNRYYLSGSDSFVKVYIDNVEKKLSSAFIYKYQGYSEDEGTTIYQVTSNFSEGASSCAKYPQADDKMATESTVISAKYDGVERKFSAAYTFEDHGLTPTNLYIWSSNDKAWLGIDYNKNPEANAGYTTSMTEVSIDDDTYTTKYTTNYTWSAQGVTKLYDENRIEINCDKEKPIEKGIYYTTALA